ncbi:hypothetical protein G6O67_005713 [Ophiocordyceps sinensis]|uniref:Uncharacterized protein n=1 Tax=Ophiocordyceps sinensis TaxID=72228 RepID=A0A8H4LY06_9HYPO|nr:hypothetical protein G6O67_005713 [Ophiocordyceps sinensis]
MIQRLFNTEEINQTRVRTWKPHRSRVDKLLWFMHSIYGAILPRLNHDVCALNVGRNKRRRLGHAMGNTRT